MAETRLFIKNLPKHITVERFKAHFETRGTVSDAKILSTKDGKSRQIGFIGYRSKEEALSALNFFDRTFIDTSRILVELAKSKGDENLPRPWSQYSEGSSRFKKKTMQVLQAGTSIDTHPKKKKTKIQQDDDKEASSTVADRKGKHKISKEEFSAVMKRRLAAKPWANDEGSSEKQPVSPQSKLYKPAEPILDDDEDSEAENIEDSSADLKLKKEISDMEYLKSKIQKRLDDGSDEEGLLGQEPAELTGANTVSKFPEEKSSQLLEGANDEDEDEDFDSGRLFVRNLPFAVTEEEIAAHFQRFGELSSVHLALDDAKKFKGFCFVQFMIPEHAEKAMKELDRTSFQGRIMHILHAKKQPGNEQDLNSDRGKLTYKTQKEAERRKKLGDQAGWHASYMRSDTVVDALADRLGVQKGDILDRESSSSIAVRLAVGETHILQENKEYFKKEGIDLDALESTYSKGQAIERSKTAILVKNLPFSTEISELNQLFGKFGTLVRVLLPPSKTAALVEFVEAIEARKAFRSLAYKRFQHVPLYLEWAPLKVLKEKPVITEHTTETDIAQIPENALLLDEDESDANSLYVKNLSFATTDQELWKAFQKCEGVRTAVIQKRKKGSKVLSMGYGFVEFTSKDCMDKALRTMNGQLLNGHALQIQAVKKKGAKNAKRAGSKDKAKNPEHPPCTKIIIRNLAFQATAKEVRALFAEFGELKKVRLPKKFDGSNRGFAFVEFLTAKEAETAYDTLMRTHLYGRHLVLEWAKDEETIEELRNKASRDLKGINLQSKKRKLKNSFEEIIGSF